MGMFDSVNDVTATGPREIQVKCFGKSLTTFNVGDAVQLHVAITGDEIGVLEAEIEHFEMELGDDTVRIPTGPAFSLLLDGRPSEMTTYQVAVRDGSFITVVDGILTATCDTRDDTVPAVDNWGLPFSDNTERGAWV